jgi:hypothetical protein
MFHLFPLLPTEIRLQIYTHIHAHSTSPLPSHTHTTRILKLNFSPSLDRYISNCAPPAILSVCAEAREYARRRYGYEYLALGSNFFCAPRTDIPLVFEGTTIYVSGLHPLLSTFAQSFLYHLSTSPSRHKITSIALDLRCWRELCELGLLGVLAGMRGLREVLMVVEYGRRFEGEFGFLEQPEWRSDLRWSAALASESLRGERERGQSRRLSPHGAVDGEEEAWGHVDVRCVILTRGGEQA